MSLSSIHDFKKSKHVLNEEDGIDMSRLAGANSLLGTGSEQVDTSLYNRLNSAIGNYLEQKYPNKQDAIKAVIVATLKILNTDLNSMMSSTDLQRSLPQQTDDTPDSEV